MQNAPHQLCIGHLTNFANIAKRTIGALLTIFLKDVLRPLLVIFMQKTLAIISLLVLASCGTKYRSISEFNIKPTALKDGERIKLLFCDGWQHR